METKKSTYYDLAKMYFTAVVLILLCCAAISVVCWSVCGMFESAPDIGFPTQTGFLECVKSIAPVALGCMAGPSLACGCICLYKYFKTEDDTDDK